MCRQQYLQRPRKLQDYWWNACSSKFASADSESRTLLIKILARMEGCFHISIAETDTHHGVLHLNNSCSYRLPQLIFEGREKWHALIRCHRNSQAITIQRFWKGFLGRRILNRLKADRAASQCHRMQACSAIVIQVHESIQQTGHLFLSLLRSSCLSTL